MRWTRSRAEAFVLARGGERAVKLLVCGGPAERGSDPQLTLRIEAANGQSLLSVSAVVPRGEWTHVELALPEALPGGEVKLTLESPSFVPAKTVGNADGRDLGIGLRGLELVG
jgi:hypothetical protein